MTNFIIPHTNHIDYTRHILLKWKQKQNNNNSKKLKDEGKRNKKRQKDTFYEDILFM